MRMLGVREVGLGVSIVSHTMASAAVEKYNVNK
jgi:hypothetical protein